MTFKMVCSRCKQSGHNIRSCKNNTLPSLENKDNKDYQQESYPTTTISKNSIVARSGFKAEDTLCNSPHVLQRLGSQYFHKQIVKCEKKSGNTKTDLILTFEDMTTTNLQLKNGTGGGRGWSFHRQSIDTMSIDDSVKTLLRNVCLKLGGNREIIELDRQFIRTLLLGQDESSKPEYFIHTTIKNGEVTTISICTAEVFVEAIIKVAYQTFIPKKTCVHLTPLIYLQRKGGGKSDHSPDDIQAKLRCMPDVMINIALSETTTRHLEQMHQ